MVSKIGLFGAEAVEEQRAAKRGALARQCLTLPC
jgi:hypothetical protein